jgi:hypothetical protein
MTWSPTRARSIEDGHDELSSRACARSRAHELNPEYPYAHALACTHNVHARSRN